MKLLFFRSLAALCGLALASRLAAAPTSFTVSTQGHGPAMILIPGLSSPGSVWDTTVARFGQDYTCHVISIRGFAGLPPSASNGPLLTTVRDELAAYIEENHLGHPVLVGHSLGGFIALQLAIQHPDLPRALIIVDSLPFFMGVMQPNATPADTERIAKAMVGRMAKITPAAFGQMIRTGPNGSSMARSSADLDRIVSWGVASDPATVGKALLEMYTTDLRTPVAGIRAPTLVLGAWIAYAPYSSHEIATRLYGGQYANLPGVTIKVSDTSRHFIMLDEPNWLFSQMGQFLAAGRVAQR